MASSNAEELRSFIDTHLTDIAAFIEAVEQGSVDLLDPDIVYEDANLPDHIGEVYRGYDGLVRAAGRWLEASDFISLELREIIGSGDNIVSIHHVVARSRHSGIENGAPLAYVWIFRNGKVVHWQSYRDRDEALDAAGRAVTT